jgi:hypothetical protein
MKQPDVEAHVLLVCPLIEQDPKARHLLRGEFGL